MENVKSMGTYLGYAMWYAELKHVEVILESRVSGLAAVNHRIMEVTG